MKPSVKKDILAKIHDTLTDMILTIEENRYSPSVREAGSAPTDSAVQSAEDMLIALIEDIAGEVAHGTYQINPGDLTKVESFEEILDQIKLMPRTRSLLSEVEEFEELEEVETFDRDNGERKYTYVNTIFEHSPSKRFICIEEQCTSGDDSEFLSISNISEVTKEEKITYEWT